MKNTKTILTTALLTLMTFGIAIYQSCKKDQCKGVSCLNGGTCNGGTCTCASGYSGATCANEVSQHFTGNWGGYTSTDEGNISNTVTITNSTSSPFKLSILGSSYTLTPIWAVGVPNNDSMITFTGTIEDGDTTYFTLNNTFLVDDLGDTCNISGTGFIKGDTVQINFNSAYLSSTYINTFKGGHL